MVLVSPTDLRYMRGRVTYDQINAAVRSINAAAKAKYRILHQPLRSLNNHSRKLHARFKEQETKDTKGTSHFLCQAGWRERRSGFLGDALASLSGQCFVVEEDIRELVQIKVDKRFQGMLNMLRHCQRLRELRGGGLTRYILL